MIIRLVDDGDLPLRDVYNYAIKLRDELKIKKDIYIEIWDRKSFENYFEYCQTHSLIYDHALDQMKPIQGLYQSKDILNEQYYKHCYHNIAIVDDSDWIKTLCHEMIHAQQSEIMGPILWNMLGDIYKDKRIDNPTEAHAPFLANRMVNQLT